MLWKLLQMVVFVAVLFANIYWQWTPNGFVAGTLAFIVSFGVTVLLADIFRFLAWLRFKLWPLGRKDRPQYRNLRRRQVF